MAIARAKFLRLLWLAAIPLAAEVSSLARAEDSSESFILLKTPYYEGGEVGMRKILTFRADRCVEELRPILAPEAVIRDGLVALQGGAGPQANAPCLAKIVEDWNELLAEPKAPPPVDPSGDAPHARAAAQAKFQRALIEFYCTATGNGIPTGPLGGQKDSCAGVDPDPSLRAAREKALAEARKVRASFTVEEEIDSRIPDLAESFQAPFDESEIQKLRQQAQCASESGSLPDHCGGNRLGKAESGAIRDALNQQFEKRQTWRARLYPLKELLRIKGPSPFYDRAALLAANRKYHCLGGGTVYLADEKKPYCERNGLATEGNLEAAKAEILKVISDPDATAQSYLAAEKEKEDKRKAALPAQQESREHDYAIRRLLALYQSFSRQHKGEENLLGKFCRENEEVQKRDRAFSLGQADLRPLRSDEEWRWASRLGASEGEINAIKQYTGFGYLIINRAIWNSKDRKHPLPIDPDIQLSIEILKRALNQAPAYRDGPVRRFAALPDDVLATHQVGKLITYDAFTSTSTNKDWAWEVGSDGPVSSFLIYPGNAGVDVHSISDNASEGEVLFKAGTRFKVLSRKKSASRKGAYEFVLAEVDEKGQVIADLPKAGKRPRP